MNQPQRIVLVLYCLLLTYCAAWIPWCVRPNYPHRQYERVGYGWLWAGPYRTAPVVYNPPIKAPDGMTILGEEDLRSSGEDVTAMPDWPLIAMRVLAGSGLFAVAFLLAGSRCVSH
jgi:hypothetical protein